MTKLNWKSAKSNKINKKYLALSGNNTLPYLSLQGFTSNFAMCAAYFVEHEIYFNNIILSKFNFDSPMELQVCLCFYIILHILTQCMHKNRKKKPKALKWWVVCSILLFFTK